MIATALCMIRPVEYAQCYRNRSQTAWYVNVKDNKMPQKLRKPDKEYRSVAEDTIKVFLRKQASFCEETNQFGDKQTV